MSTSLLMIILLLLALLMMAIEVFVIPGFGVAGIISAGCLIWADVMIYNEFGILSAFLVLVGFSVLTILLIWWVTKSKMLEEVALKSSIDSTNATLDQLSVRVGDEGVALTRLALIGNAIIEGRMVEVKSTGKFIEEGTPLVVVKVHEAMILVEEKKD